MLVNCLAPNIIALTVWTLEGSTKMIPGSGLFEADFIFYLGQSCPIEISRHFDFESVQRM